MDDLDARLERAQGFLVRGTLSDSEYLRLRGQVEDERARWRPSWPRP